LDYRVDEHLAIITLNRPDKLNALDEQLVGELDAALDRVEDDPQIRCVILAAAGDRAFSVGYDLSGAEGPARTDTFLRQLDHDFGVFMKLWRLRVPVIAAVDGYAIAAGCNLAMLCDVTVASDRAKFGEPEIRHVALSPLLLLPWFNGNPKAVHYFYYSGDTIGAEEALAMGIVARVVRSSDLMPECLRMAKRIALVPPHAAQMMKRSLRQTYESMGFLTSLQQHRMVDALVLGAVGIPEKDRFDELASRGDMATFLRERDGPFKADVGS